MALKRAPCLIDAAGNIPKRLCVPDRDGIRMLPTRSLLWLKQLYQYTFRMHGLYARYITPPAGNFSGSRMPGFPMPGRNNIARLAMQVFILIFVFRIYLQLIVSNGLLPFQKS
jgi:hypothetical protein